MNLQIYPSLFAFQTLNIGKEIEKFSHFSSGLHVDIIDGNYINGFGFPIYMIEMLKNYTSLPIHIHAMAMIDNIISDIISLRPDLIFFHLDSTSDPNKVIELFKNANINIGIAVSNFSEEFMHLKQIIENYQIKNILLMCVKPGKSGQKFIQNKFLEIEKLRNAFPDVNIIIDGGVTPEIIQNINQTNQFVVGSALYKYDWSLLKK